MADKQHILLVDDDPNISHLVRLYLEKEGFGVTECDRGDTAIDAFRSCNPALVLLDVMLPGKDGLEVLKEIRMTSKVPVIMLTAKDETFDKVLGLELGADDYITKPFENKELVARVKAVLRRAPGEAEPASHAAKPEKNDTLRFPGLTVSLASYEVTYEGKPVEMPPKELEVLYYLASHPNMVFTPRPAVGTGMGLQLLRRQPHGGRSHQASAGKAAGLRKIRLGDPHCLARGLQIRLQARLIREENRLVSKYV